MKGGEKVNFENVFERFKSYADLSENDAQKWEYLVYDSIGEVRCMLLPGCDVEGNCHRLITAAAALAFYRYHCICAARRGADSFKAGDVTVNISDKGVEHAHRMYREAMQNISDIVGVDDFVFGRIDSICTES